MAKYHLAIQSLPNPDRGRVYEENFTWLKYVGALTVSPSIIGLSALTVAKKKKVGYQECHIQTRELKMNAGPAGWLRKI